MPPRSGEQSPQQALTYLIKRHLLLSGSPATHHTHEEPGLALLLIRIVETTTGDTWPTIRRHLNRLPIGTFTGPTSLLRQTTALTRPRDLLATTFDVPTPKRIIELTTTC